ncbi:hypothetical protein RCCGE510_13610 [Rhizobium sp. CCGE 510]|nr:hypothetical protein RCCGE510_13610 [Rhizobium sp. CCGE 510]
MPSRRALFAAVRRDPGATGPRGRKSSILNTIVARMRTIFHLYTRYGLLQPSLVIGSETLHAKASANMAFTAS